MYSIGIIDASAAAIFMDVDVLSLAASSIVTCKFSNRKSNAIHNAACPKVYAYGALQLKMFSFTRM